MSHRSRFVASVCFTFLAACGGTVVVDRADDGSGGGGDGGSTAGPVASITATSTPSANSSAIASTGSTADDVSSVDVVTSTGSGGFGTQDLYPQYLGEPLDERNPFTLADNALGAQIFARAPSDFGEAQLDRLTAPSGSVVFDQFIPSNNQYFYNYGVTSMVIPQIDHPEVFDDVAPGTWSVRISPFGNVNDVTVLERQTVDGEFHGGVLDVNVFVVPGTADPDYLLSQIQNGFANWGGLSLGDVRFFDAPDNLFEVDENNYFDAQAASASGPAGQAINFLTVGYIGGAFEGAAGFTPGAPADPIVRGSSAGTIVWWVQNDGFFDSIIVGHEAGHFAGLDHTTEFDGGSDPLSDTATCPDIDFPYDFCGDYDYLMFPTGGSGAFLMSPKQVQVIQGSAIYRGIYQPGDLPAPPFEDLLGGQRIAAPAARTVANALPLDGIDARARAPVAATTPRSLRSSLPAEVAAIDGFGCGAEGAMSTLIDDAAAASTASELLALARDPRAAPMLRMRALLAAARAPGAAAIVGDLKVIAGDPAMPEQVRAGAIRALDRIAPQERAAISAVLRGDPSRLVRHLASK